MRTTILLAIIISIAMANDAAAQPTAQQTWGLCIGIAEYEPADLTLQWSDKDATEFSTFLRYGLGLPEDHYRILRNREATRENILEHFGWLNMVANTGDRVFIFYSGHGKQNSPILPYDSDSLITLDKIKRALSKIEAQEIIFFADACYSGKLAGKGAKAAIERESLTGLSKGVAMEMSEAKDTGIVIITSANGIQEAYEQSGSKNGIFTYHLMKALMDKERQRLVDQDQDGRVTLFELYHDLYRAVTNESQQEPQISDPERAKEIVLFSVTGEAEAAAPTSTASAPEAAVRLKRLTVNDEQQQRIEPVNGIYAIKAGQVVTMTVDVAAPADKTIKIEWLAGYGKITSIQPHLIAYAAQQPGGDYVIVSILDANTGQRLFEEPLNLTVLP